MCLSFLGLLLGSCGDNPSSSSEVSVFLTSHGTDSAADSPKTDPSSDSSSSLRATYTVIWKNGDQVLETDTVYVDEAGRPSYDGATPTRETDAQYVYTFDGWCIEGESVVYSEADLASLSVSQSMTFVAHYSTELRYYDVSWKVGDVTLETDTHIAYGTKPSFDADENVGEDEEFNYFDSYETKEFTYTFDGWQINGEGEAYQEDDLPIVSGNTTYVAHFLEEIRTYHISWKNGKTTLETDTVEYGSIPELGINPPTKEPSDGYTYYFDGWTKDSPTSDTFYSPDSLPPVDDDAFYYIHYGAIKDTGLNLLSNSSNNAVAVIDDEAYIFKGSESSTNKYSNVIYKWNPTDGCVNTGITQPLSVCSQAAVEYDGKIYLFGGETSANPALNSIYVFDPALGTVTNTGLTMRTGRCSPRAALYDGKIYVTGGYGGNDNSSVEVFDPSENTIVDTGMNTSRSAGSTMVPIEDDIYFFGKKDIILGGIYALDWTGEDATKKEAELISSLDYGTAVNYKGRIYTIGGSDYTDDIDNIRYDSDIVACYDATQDSYSDSNIRLPHALSHMSAAVINERI